jgi:hypothetical protein
LIRDIDPPIETSTWPYLQVEVPLETVQRISSEEASLDLDAQVKLVKESATVLAPEDKVWNIFGRLRPENIPLAKLLRKHPSLLDCCCQQIAEASANKIPQIRSVSVKDREEVTEFVPVVTKVRRGGYLKAELFDLCFVKLPTSVPYKMFRKSQFYWKPWSKQFEQQRLLEVSEKMRGQEKNRLPVLESNVVRYVIHSAVIDEFIVANHERAKELTIHDLLADDCVTQPGSPQEAVRGWLTDVDLAQAIHRPDDKQESVSTSVPTITDSASVAVAVS